MTRAAFLFLVIGAAACGSKHGDRDELCRVAKETLSKGLVDQAAEMEKAGNKDSAQAMRAMLSTIDKRWDGFCHALDDHDIDCLSKGAAAIGDADCKGAVDKMKTQLLGM